jgi:hypothetical protein
VSVARPLSRAFALAGFAAIAVPAVAAAQLPAYAPSAAKYRVETLINIAQSAMGQTMEFTSTSKQLISVNIAGGAPAFDLTMVLDSISATSTSPQPMPDNSGLVGMKLTGKIGPNGLVSDEKAVDKAGVDPKTPIAQSLKTLFPKLQPGAKVGESWKDSSLTKGSQGGIETTTITLTTYKYDGDSTVAGTKFAKVSAAADAKVSGKGNAQGQDLSLDGTSKSTSVYLIATTGVFHGGTTQFQADLNVTVEAMGMVVPITQKGTNKVERSN